LLNGLVLRCDRLGWARHFELRHGGWAFLFRRRSIMDKAARFQESATPCGRSVPAPRPKRTESIASGRGICIAHLLHK
jgi:hypothetical protein